MSSLLARRAFKTAQRLSLPRAMGQTTSLARLSSTLAAPACATDDRQYWAMAAAATAVAAGVTLDDYNKKADCCGIAGVVGTKGHDAR